MVAFVQVLHVCNSPHHFYNPERQAMLIFLLIRNLSGAREIAQWLATLAALAED